MRIMMMRLNVSRAVTLTASPSLGNWVNSTSDYGYRLARENGSVGLNGSDSPGHMALSGTGCSTYLYGDVPCGLYYLYLFGQAILIFGGILGNLCALVVLLITHLRQISSSIYLMMLAITDSSVLLCLLLANWWSMLAHSPTDSYLPLCSGVMYVHYVAAFLSVWLVVAFSVERCIAVICPLHVATVCTRRRAAQVTVCLLLVSLVVNAPIPQTLEVIVYEGTSFCITKETSESLSVAMNMIDSVLTFLLPCPMIIAINAIILFKLRLQASASHGMSRQKKGQTMFNDVLKMLLITSTVFLCVHVPFQSMRFGQLVAGGQLNMEPQFYLQFVYQMQFAVNFLLYNFSGSNFRRPVLAILRHMVGRGEQMSWRQAISRRSMMHGSVRHSTAVRCSFRGSPSVGITSTMSRRSTKRGSNPVLTSVTRKNTQHLVKRYSSLARGQNTCNRESRNSLHVGNVAQRGDSLDPQGVLNGLPNSLRDPSMSDIEQPTRLSSSPPTSVSRLPSPPFDTHKQFNLGLTQCCNADHTVTTIIYPAVDL